MKVLICVMAVLSVAGCTTAPPQKRTAPPIQQPVSCATSKGDLRTLAYEKVHTGQQIAAGAPAVFPVSLVVDLNAGNEAADYRVATGKYNELIEQRIVEIKTACGGGEVALNQPDAHQ